MKTDTRKYWRSSSFKMAVLFTVLLGLSAGVLGYFSYYFNRDHYVQGPSEVIDTELKYLLYEDGLGHLTNAIDEMGTRKTRIYLLQGPDKRKLAGNFQSLPGKISVLAEGIILFDLGDQHYAAKVHMFDDSRTLIAGTNITTTADAYHRLQILSSISIFVMAVVAFVSFLISSFVVSRTNHIAATALSIMKTGDLSKRIHIDARWDDLGNMAHVLNLLLKRVEDLMAGIRQVSDNIAHDLRTPLTRLLNHLETMKGEKAVADHTRLKDISDAMLEETHRLLDTFNALLRITAIETRQQRKNFASLSLDRIAQDVIDLYEPLAEEKSLRLTRKILPVSMTGDRDLLFQAIANILANAIEFTPPGGRIGVALKFADGRTVLEISDSGPGIRENEREKIFERFYRSDESRSRKGNGLGLSLVAAIVDLHNGRITLEDARPGLIFKVFF